MNKLSAIALGAGLALASISLAHADSAVTGAWKLSVGTQDDPCTVTLNADQDSAGSATSNGDCNGVYVGHWKTVGSSLQLLSANGTLVAWLKPEGGAYEGKRVSDGRAVALNR
jgi:hypothetical protein